VTEKKETGDEFVRVMSSERKAGKEKNKKSKRNDGQDVGSESGEKEKETSE
jgi:hypothetical protein